MKNIKKGLPLVTEYEKYKDNDALWEIYEIISSIYDSYLGGSEPPFAPLLAIIDGPINNPDEPADSGFLDDEDMNIDSMGGLKSGVFIYLFLLF